MINFNTIKFHNAFLLAKKDRVTFLEDTQTDNSSDVDSDPCSLEDDSGSHDETSYKLRSRPAIRQAAKVAKSKIAETSLLQDHETPEHSPLTSTKSPRAGLYATPLSIEKPRRDLNASQTSLFGPTPNNTAVFDFTLSEDDQLVTGLPRLGKETPSAKVKTMKKPLRGDFEIVDLDDGVQPMSSYSSDDEMFQCINAFRSTLRLIESDFKTRINQLKEQVDKMYRLLQWSRRGQAKGRKAHNAMALW
ncbi:unnamed protein product [Rodentolepis nana]|uniref:ECM11 domain-containing protein n=1 Tax=Rodentolepis nana TaxID=102285 RepID=A0A0R3TBJ1_RODNA|nr:unnamed protein product [Rodentolepis nana]